MAILRHVRGYLMENEWKFNRGPHVTDAILIVDLCVSRVNSDLVI